MLGELQLENKVQVEWNEDGRGFGIRDEKGGVRGGWGRLKGGGLWDGLRSCQGWY